MSLPSLVMPEKIYSLNRKIEDFTFSMPSGWDDYTISVFLEACHKYSYDLRTYTGDFMRQWSRIVNYGFTMTSNLTCFNITVTMELAKVLKAYLLKNENAEEYKNNEYFKDLLDDTRDLLVYFPNANESQRPALQPEKCDCSEDKPVSVAEVIETVSKQYRHLFGAKGIPASILWSEMSQKVSEKTGLKVDVKQFLEPIKIDIAVKVRQERDPEERVKKFLVLAKDYLAYFDYIPPRNIKKAEFLPPELLDTAVEKEVEDDMTDSLNSSDNSNQEYCSEYIESNSFQSIEDFMQVEDVGAYCEIPYSDETSYLLDTPSNQEIQENIDVAGQSISDEETFSISKINKDKLESLFPKNVDSIVTVESHSQQLLLRSFFPGLTSVIQEGASVTTERLHYDQDFSTMIKLPNDYNSAQAAEVDNPSNDYNPTQAIELDDPSVNVYSSAIQAVEIDDSSVNDYTPSTQSTEVDNPSNDYNPSTQAIELDDPSVNVYSSSTQAIEIDYPSVNDYTPSTQATEVNNPSNDYNPSTQAIELDGPSVNVYSSSTQAIEIDDPSVNDCTPSNQAVEIDDPSTNDYSSSSEVIEIDDDDDDPSNDYYNLSQVIEIDDPSTDTNDYNSSEIIEIDDDEEEEDDDDPSNDYNSSQIIELDDQSNDDYNSSSEVIEIDDPSTYDHNSSSQGIEIDGPSTNNESDNCEEFDNSTAGNISILPEDESLFVENILNIESSCSSNVMDSRFLLQAGSSNISDSKNEYSCSNLEVSNYLETEMETLPKDNQSTGEPLSLLQIMQKNNSSEKEEFTNCSYFSGNYNNVTVVENQNLIMENSFLERISETLSLERTSHVEETYNETNEKNNTFSNFPILNKFNENPLTSDAVEEAYILDQSETNYEFVNDNGISGKLTDSLENLLTKERNSSPLIVSEAVEKLLIEDIQNDNCSSENMFTDSISENITSSGQCENNYTYNGNINERTSSEHNLASEESETEICTPPSYDENQFKLGINLDENNIVSLSSCEDKHPEEKETFYTDQNSSQENNTSDECEESVPFRRDIWKQIWGTDFMLNEELLQNSSLKERSKSEDNLLYRNREPNDRKLLRNNTKSASLEFLTAFTWNSTDINFLNNSNALKNSENESSRLIDKNMKKKISGSSENKSVPIEESTELVVQKPSKELEVFSASSPEVTSCNEIFAMNIENKSSHIDENMKESICGSSENKSVPVEEAPELVVQKPLELDVFSASSSEETSCNVIDAKNTENKSNHIDEHMEENISGSSENKSVPIEETTELVVQKPDAELELFSASSSEETSCNEFDSKNIENKSSRHIDEHMKENISVSSEDKSVLIEETTELVFQKKPLELDVFSASSSEKTSCNEIYAKNTESKSNHIDKNMKESICGSSENKSVLVEEATELVVQKPLELDVFSASFSEETSCNVIDAKNSENKSNHIVDHMEENISGSSENKSVPIEETTELVVQTPDAELELLSASSSEETSCNEFDSKNIENKSSRHIDEHVKENISVSPEDNSVLIEETTKLVVQNPNAELEVISASSYKTSCKKIDAKKTNTSTTSEVNIKSSTKSALTVLTEEEKKRRKKRKKRRKIKKWLKKISQCKVILRRLTEEEITSALYPRGKKDIEKQSMLPSNISDDVKTKKSFSKKKHKTNDTKSSEVLKPNNKSHSDSYEKSEKDVSFNVPSSSEIVDKLEKSEETLTRTEKSTSIPLNKSLSREELLDKNKTDINFTESNSIKKKSININERPVSIKETSSLHNVSNVEDSELAKVHCEKDHIESQELPVNKESENEENLHDMIRPTEEHELITKKRKITPKQKVKSKKLKTSKTSEDDNVQPKEPEPEVIKLKECSVVLQRTIPYPYNNIMEQKIYEMISSKKSTRTPNLVEEKEIGDLLLIESTTTEDESTILKHPPKKKKKMIIIEEEEDVEGSSDDDNDPFLGFSSPSDTYKFKPPVCKKLLNFNSSENVGRVIINNQVVILKKAVVVLKDFVQSAAASLETDPELHKCSCDCLARMKESCKNLPIMQTKLKENSSKNCKNLNEQNQCDLIEKHPNQLCAMNTNCPQTVITDDKEIIECGKNINKKKSLTSLDCDKKDITRGNGTTVIEIAIRLVQDYQKNELSSSTALRHLMDTAKEFEFEFDLISDLKHRKLSKFSWHKKFVAEYRKHQNWKVQLKWKMEKEIQETEKNKLQILDKVYKLLMPKI